MTGELWLSEFPAVSDLAEPGVYLGAPCKAHQLSGDEAVSSKAHPFTASGVHEQELRPVALGHVSHRLLACPYTCEAKGILLSTDSPQIRKASRFEAEHCPKLRAVKILKRSRTYADYPDNVGPRRGDGPQLPGRIFAAADA